MNWIPQVVLAVGVFVGFLIGSSVVRAFFFRLSRVADFNTAYILRLAGRLVGGGLLLFGTVTALGTMGVNVGALVAGLGLTGFALGFAMKDVLSNLVSGVLILVYRPFVLNNRITVSGLEGVVTEIDLRYTRLDSGTQTYLIPNSMLITNTIGLIPTTDAQSTDCGFPLRAAP